MEKKENRKARDDRHRAEEEEDVAVRYVRKGRNWRSKVQAETSTRD